MRKMYLRIALIMGLLGLFYLPFGILLIKGKTLGMFRGMKQDAETSYNKKSITLFFGKVYIAVALLCFCGAVLTVLELLPIQVLYLFIIVPVVSPLSLIYLNKSTRFRNTE